MSAAPAVQNRIENLIAMAQLLELVDAKPTVVGAQQYRSLVDTVQRLLDDPEIPEDARRAVLRASPACALLYENLHYDRSGLSQSPLDAAVASELAAADLIGRLRARSQPAA